MPLAIAPHAPVETDLAADCLRVAAGYFAARQSGDAAALEPLLAHIWHSKKSQGDGTVTVETRAAFLSRMRQAGAGGRAHLSTLHLCFADFAVARADVWEQPEAIFILLFKERGVWKIAAEACADGNSAGRDARFTARNAEAEVLDVVEKYYRAVTESDGPAIRRVFAPCWHMKNHEEGVIGGSLVSEETDAFVKRLEKSYAHYGDDRQIADVQIAYDRIAFVRVDRPSTPSTTVHLLARIGGV